MYDLPPNLHILCITICLLCIIQYLDLSSIKVAFTPLCITQSQHSLTINRIRWVVLVEENRILCGWGQICWPPHLQMPVSS